VPRGGSSHPEAAVEPAQRTALAALLLTPWRRLGYSIAAALAVGVSAGLIWAKRTQGIVRSKLRMECSHGGEQFINNRRQFWLSWLFYSVGAEGWELHPTFASISWCAGLDITGNWQFSLRSSVSEAPRETIGGGISRPGNTVTGAVHINDPRRRFSGPASP
jgi:lambda repressor-like predicted transcriptional regulator